MTRALDTLHRLERRAHWTSLPMAFPSLPDDYPPPLPANLDPGDIAYDKVSEWVGDAFVEAAIFERMYLSGQVNSDACSVLRSKDVLSRLGVLYGLQRLPHVKPRPLMNTICDLFEVLVTYVWQVAGSRATFNWLEELFAPWVAQRYVSLSPTSSSWRPVDLTWLLGRHKDLVDYRREAVEWLESSIPSFPPLQLARVRLPADYPPLPPNLQSVLVDALHGGRYNRDYAALGQSLYRLAVTVIAAEEFPRLSSDGLDVIRSGCTCRPLLARLGLVFEVHRYLCHNVKLPSEAHWFITTQQSIQAVYALVAAVHVKIGWRKTLRWLDGLLSPWILAAGRGAFVSPQPVKVRLEQLRKAEHTTEYIRSRGPRRTAARIKQRK